MPPQVSPSLTIAAPEAVSVRGELGERIQRSLVHLKRLDAAEMRRELVEPDAGWHWGADYMGRWIGSMALLCQHTGDDHEVGAVVRELIGYQNDDGSFGSYGDDHDFQEWFGMGRGLVGLLDYHQVTQDRDALESARRLGDFYVDTYPDVGEFQVECYANALEGLVRLASLTGDDRYLRTARRVADTSTPIHQLWASMSFGYRGLRTPCAGSVHCHLLAGRGLLDLYEVTAEDRYLDGARALHDHLMSETLSVNGAVGEFLMGAEESETCSDADWLRFNLQLWRITGGSAYMDMAEHVLLNAILFDQASTGAFCYRRGVQGRPGASFDACCSHHGPRAMVEALRYAFAGDPEVLSVNLFLDATGRILVGGEPVAVDTVTWQDVDAQIFGARITLDPGTDRSFPVRLRVPGWAGAADVLVNGEPAADAGDECAVTVHRRWSAGDTVEVRFPLAVRLVQGQTLGHHVIDDRAVAIFFGPRLFCLTERLNPEHRLDFLRLALPPSEPERAIRVLTPERLQAAGIGPDRQPVTLELWPLAVTGGSPNGVGRTHPTKAPYFKTWIPQADGVA